MLSKSRLRVRGYLQRRYDTSGKSDLERYFGEQMAYGHREVLLKYMGLEKKFYFGASLTHGKILPDFLDPIRPQYMRDGSQILQVLWRNDAEFEAKQKGIEAVSIGATGLYALHNLGQPIYETKNNLENIARSHIWSNDSKEILDLLSNKKVLYMPLHSWDGDVISHVDSDLSILSQLSPNKVTVLLAYLDFLDLENREYYQSWGFAVQCAGIRSSKIFDSPAGGREKFLYSLFDLVERHDYVISNSLTTGLLYAACLKKNIGILPKTRLPNIVFSSWRNIQEFNTDIQIQNSFFPWLNGEPVIGSRSLYSDVCDALGVDQFKSSTQLGTLIPLIST
jgi:hypothetical protein